ncbi:TMC domain-containing protein [Aphelenchoides besseyi]|nr:TMC domain-containing protein [Aphelenchoides besseyi]
MVEWFRRLRRFVGGEEEPNDAQEQEDEENADSEAAERQPKWSQHSGTSSTYLELPTKRNRETSSLRVAGKRKPRPVHRSATDTARLSGGSGDVDPETRATYPSSVLESNSEEESSTARLSRRPSVLIDLIALFRRSSSFGGARRPSRRYHQHDEEDSDDLDDENEENAKMSKDKILASIRRKKQDLSRLPSQPWNMQRKRRMLKVAKRYLQRQQAKVNRWNLWTEEFQRRVLPQCKRWFINLRTYLIPFESRIKRIESHFGSVVSSYFTFLRWILFLNVWLTIIIVFFIVIPEWLVDSEANPKRLSENEHIKVIPEHVRKTADELKTILDFGGYMQYSYIFYGFYSKDTVFKRGPFSLRVPVAYFIVNLFLLGLSLFLILRKMASNARNSKIQGGRTEQYVFIWKVINGWDYSIGNSETAASLFKANVTKLKEAIADYNVKLKRKWTPGRIARVAFVNVVILFMIGMTGYFISRATVINKDTFIKQNAVSIIVSFVTLVFPNLFELVGHIEGHHPRTALRWHLARVFLLYITAYYTLFGSLYSLLNSMQKTHTIETAYYPTSQPFTIVYNPNARSSKAFMEGGKRRYRNRQFRQLSNSWFAANEYNNANTTDAPEFTKPPLFTFTTTPEPPKPWTTVQSNFGPFAVGVANPKVLVVSDKKLQKQVPNTVYESRPIGPLGDWRDATTQRPTPLYYATSPRQQQFARYSKGYLPMGGICWETAIGQEIVKVVVTDLVMTVMIVLIIDFLRGLWVRYFALYWCWDLEETFPEYGEFKISENVLHLIKDQTMVWLGCMFVPFLPVINIIKLITLMYLRGWSVMTCNVPARQIFRASRSNNFYLILLLLMFLFSTIPVGYVIASVQPSRSCGPFAGQPHFYTVIINALKNTLNGKLVSLIEGIMSPGIIIPVLLFLLLVIYFMFALIRGLHDANHELSEELTRERTEEKRRIFELAGGGKRKHHGTNGVQIPKTSPEKGGKVATSSPQRSLKSPTSLVDDFSHHHSPSKSPISPRAANRSFLPSLQSLKEDDDNAEDEENETREPEATQQLLRRESSPSTIQHHSEDHYDELPPIKLNWKQRLLVLIGVLDRDKVEAKLRMKQLAENAYEDDHTDDEEEPQRRRTPPQLKDVEEEEDTTSAPVQNEPLEEASSSTSGAMSEEPSSDAAIIQRNVRTRLTPAIGRAPSRSPWSRGGSRGTGGTDEDTGGELLTVINTGRPASRIGSVTPHRSTTPPHQPQQRAPSQRRAQRAGTTASSSPWLEEQPRRSFSMNNPRHLQPPFERDLASESSPLMEHRPGNFNESHRLSPEKRSPPSAGMRKRSSGSEFALDPTPMVYDGSFWDHAHKSNRMQLSDEATRPPSEETSFRDPTPSRSEEIQRQAQSPFSDFQDDRLAYANPYSSYAAAMSSPLMPEHLENDPFVQRLRQMPTMSVTPEPSNFRPVNPYAAYNAPPIQNPQPYYMTPLTPTFSPVRPRNTTRFSSLQPPTPQLQSARQTPQQQFFPSPTIENYSTPPPPGNYSPYRASQQRTPIPIYSPDHYNTEPRYSADPRNITPSGGYISGNTNSPTPEIGSPRFRISASPPRRQRQTYLSEVDSGRGSGSGGQSDPSLRRWDMRQRGTVTSTDDSTSPERSPTRQVYSQQTTV